MRAHLSGVRQGYRGRLVLDGLDLALGPGVTALLGPNGAGKTTLMRTLATVQPPIEGTVTIGDTVVSDERTARRVRRQIGYLPQAFGWDPGMRVGDFVEYAAWLREIPARDCPRAVEEALRHVDLVDRRRDRLSRLSGGMCRRAGIAWAVVGAPGLVILDEPTAGLDPRQRLQFRRIVTGLPDTTVLLSTHLIDDVAAACDRVVVLHGGRLRFDGSVADMEARACDGLPGHTPLERAYMELLPEEERTL